MDIYKNIDDHLIKFSISAYNTIADKPTDLKVLYDLHESTYKYLEGINMNKYKDIEKLVKKYQKKIQNFLLQKYNININGNPVSQAWLKFYTMVYSTNFFDNIKQKPDIFYICEAPGNFIAATLYYKNNIRWNAQSLNYDKSDIFDLYGFIKENPKRWDFGQDATGDITSYDNFIYYIDKYKNSDALIGDCGAAWVKDCNVNLGTYQLIYALLVVKVGGNFIIKTYAPNTDPLYISLLYTAFLKYEELYFFRSSRNFWSSEIYVIGKNFKGMSEIERDQLIELFKNGGNGNSNNVSKEFIKQYISIMTDIIQSYKRIKKIFAYLVKNPDKYNIFKKGLDKMVDEQNKKWLSTYMSHLENVIDEYDKYDN